jgi:GAF domain-containing protein
MGEHQLPSEEKQIVALGRVLQTLREEENADVLIETTLTYLQAEFQYRLLWIGLYDRLDHRLFGKGGVTPTGDTSFLKQKFFLNPGDLLEQVVIQQRPVGIPNLSEEVRAGEWRRAAQQFGIQGTLLFPLRCKDRCFGVALLGSHLWGVSPRAAEKAQLSVLFGGLAAALYQIEVDWQRSSTKRPDQPMFEILDQMLHLPTMQQRLEAVCTTTQKFVAPTRTSIYWYNSERRYFWHRAGNRQMVRGLANSNSASGLLVLEVHDFYQALCEGRLITIGAGRSPLKAESTGRLLSKLRARSVLAAPITVREELVGFLAVEGNEARIWEEAEKNYVRAAAGMVALVAGSEDVETAIGQMERDNLIMQEIAAAISDNDNAQGALKECAIALLERLGAERFLLLQEDREGAFNIVYQQQPLNRRPVASPPEPLGADHRRLLEESAYKLVAIEDWEDDERFKSLWGSLLIPLGVRSLLVCRCGNVQPIGLLVIGLSQPRTWSVSDRKLVSVAAKQIGMLLHGLAASETGELESIAYSSLMEGLNTLLSLPRSPQGFDRGWMEYLASLLSCPQVAILTWTSGESKATVNQVVTDSSLRLPGTLTIHPDRDALIQEAIKTRSPICRPLAALPNSTREWVQRASGIGEIVVFAVDIPAEVSDELGVVIPQLTQNKYPLKAAILLADRAGRKWPRHLFPVLETLVRQFSHFRHYLHLSSVSVAEVSTLEELNWFKHRCLQAFHQTVAISVSRLLELERDVPGQQGSKLAGDQSSKGGEQIRTTNISHSTRPSPGEANSAANDQPLRRMRSSQLLHQLENTLATLSPLLNDVPFATNAESVPLANLLKRSLRLVESLTTGRQQLARIHNPGNFSVYGDRLKLECVFFELLLFSCTNTKPGGRIDIWCLENRTPEAASQQVGKSRLELLITDNGLIDLNLLTALQRGDIREALPSSPLLDPPSLHLKICQRVLRSWGGEVQFYHLENGHLITRLLLLTTKSE